MKLSANHSIRYFDQLLRRLWSTGSKTTILHATAVTLLSLAAVLRAELSVIESLEWKTMDSPLVVRGRIIAGEEVTPKTSRYDAALTIAVTEVLKGSAKETSMEFYPKEDSEIVQEWIKSGHDYLFFFRVATPDRDDREIAGKWVLRGLRGSVFDLGNPRGAYSAEMTILKSGDQILDLVHRWGARNSKEVDFGEPHYGKGKAGSISIDVPFETPICRENYGGSAVEMIVPAEEKHREMALKLIGSDHPWDRAQGAGILGNLPESAASVSLLRKMLDDAGESQGCYSGYELAEFTYPARNAAWAALIYLGHKPEAKPVSRRSPTREEQEKYLRDYWNRLIADALGKQWKVNSIEPNAAPPGWTRSQGPDGFVLKCGTQEDSLPALLPVYVMPKEWLSSHSLAWAAVSAEGSLDDLMRHVARSASLEVPKATDTPAAYLGVKEFGAQGACHVFVLPTCPAEIKEKLVRHWELKIVEAPKP